MAAKKSTNSSNKQYKNRKGATAKTAAKSPRNKTQSGSSYEYVPYILIIAAILLLLLFVLNDTGIVGKLAVPAFKGLFGYGIYAIPFYLVVCALFWKHDREHGSGAGRYLLCAVNFIFLLAIIDLHTTTDAERSFSPDGISFLKVFYQNGKAGIGTGVIGGMIGSTLDLLVQTVMSYIISYLVAVVTFIFLVGSTPLRFIKAIAAAIKKIALVRRAERPAKQIEMQPVNHEVVREKPVKAKPAEQTGSSRTTEKHSTIIMDPAGPEDMRATATPVTPAAPVTPVIPVAPVVPEPEPVPEEPVSAFEQTVEDFYSPINESTSPVAEGDVTVTEIASEAPAEPAEEEVAAEETLVTETETAGAEDAPAYTFPPIELLAEGSTYTQSAEDNVAVTGQKLVNVLRSYGVNVTLVSTSRGPAVTRYEVLPDDGVRVSRIEGLATDIRIRLAAKSVRIETNIPGKAAVGIEIPNETSSIVRLRDLLENDRFKNNPSKLFVCLGMDVAGHLMYFDIADMPHLLVAGATGMGKSVCLNSILVSLLYRAKPDEVKLILVDPKKVEFSCFNGIPHLLVPVVTEARTAAGSLNWAVKEMERRYSLMEDTGTRKIEEYNNVAANDDSLEKLPYIVIVIDELADLMMTAKDAVENSICRLSAKARAAGIHLIVGTQRPSTDVVSGLIKANIPSRIAFAVSQAVDSRIILDEGGAEALLGKGDMIYAPVNMMKKLRVQGAFVDGQTEVVAVCKFIKDAVSGEYDPNVVSSIAEQAKLCGEKPGKHASAEGGEAVSNEQEDPLFLDALGVAFEYETMSTSLLQRKLSVGYSRAQKMIDMMEDRGYVGKFDPSTKKRAILMSREEYDEYRLKKGGSDAV